MDNEQVREWLARNAQEERGTFNRATIERLLADSDELARLRAEIAGARISTVQENRGYMKDCSYYAPAPKELDGTRVRLVPDGGDDHAQGGAG